MEHYAGLDVSLELTSACVVDAQGQVVREVMVASETNEWRDNERSRYLRALLPKRTTSGRRGLWCSDLARASPRTLP